MLSDYLVKPTFGMKLAGLMLATGLSVAASAQFPAPLIGTDQNSLTGVDDNIRDFLSANRGANGGGDQSLQGGDALMGTDESDLLIGALGIDALFGLGGNDVLIGGTEDFNPFNRDRAFGGDGDDTFIWAPGDGNDFFSGGEGVDVLMIGVIGEERDSDGSSSGAPFFNVSPPSAIGSKDFDGIFVEPANGLPIVNVAGGPGFCEVVDGSTDATEQSQLDELGLDHIVRFFLRGPASDVANPDTGLRIAVHLQSTEFLVCGGQNSGEVVVVDLTTSPPEVVDVSTLPEQAFALIQ